MSLAEDLGRRLKKHPAIFQCSLCPKRFTRAFNLRGHHRSVHTKDRPFSCIVCGLGFARMNDRKSHELIHAKEKKFVCEGDLANGQKWGCGHRFTLGKNLGRHFRSDKGRTCIRPLLDEEMSKRQVAANALTGLAGSLSAPEQLRQPPPPAEEWAYLPVHPSHPLVTNGGGQWYGPEHVLPQLSVPELPTRDEALRRELSWALADLAVRKRCLVVQGRKWESRFQHVGD